MTIHIQPGRMEGRVAAPPSKSYAHRLLIAAALSPEKSTIEGVGINSDIAATLGCLKALGAEAEAKNGVWYLRGTDLKEPVKGDFPCGESASTLRFLLPVALAGRCDAVFHGSERLMERGIGLYEKLFAEKKIIIEKRPTCLSVKGRLMPGEYRLDGSVSSQFISGLLFALPLLPGESRLTVLPPVESRPYVDMTLDVLKHAGIEIEKTDMYAYCIPGRQTYRPLSQNVEGDWSNAAVLLALESVGHALTVTGLREDSLQGDRAVVNFLRKLEREKPTIDLSDTPDLAPVLFAAAAAKNGAVFTGVRRLRIKESDRLGSMAEELLKCGVSCVMEENRMTIRKGGLCAPQVPLSTHNDHRVAMALSLIASLVGGEITGAEAVEKSWPGYWDTLGACGCSMDKLADRA